MNFENLRKTAYFRLACEKRDYVRIDKVIEGIAQGKITKDNVYAEVRKMSRGVKTDHAIKRWQCIADWFAKYNWC